MSHSTQRVSDGVPAEKLRVLFVEDNANDVELSLIALHKDGFSVDYDVVKTPGEFDRLLNEKEYDVLVSDFFLGPWDGLRALEHLQKGAREIPFILVTGTLGEEKAVECLRAGVSDYLLKDSLSRLPSVIRRVLADKARAIEHRQGQEQLRRSEEYFRSLIENISDIISIVDPAGTFLYFSPSVESILGYRPIDLVGQHASSLVRPDDLDSLSRLIGGGEHQVGKGEPVEFYFRHSDGTWRLLESKASSPRPDAGLTGVIVTSRDITEQRRGELELRESEERFRATFEQAAVGMAHLGVDGQWLRVNRRLCEIVGYTSAELLQKTEQEITHPDDLTIESEHARDILAGEIGTYARQKRFIRKNGTTAWVNVTTSLVASATGTAKYFIGVIEDITERRKVEAAVVESEARFRQLAENVQEVFWLANLDKSEIIYASPAFEKIWGIPSETLYTQPQTWLESIHQDDRERVKQSFARRRIGDNYDDEYRIHRQDGSVCWIRERAFPIRDSEGRFYRLAGIAEDITKNKQLEAQFLQAQKMESVGRLAGGVAHDFNNLLTAIGSFARLAMETIPPESQAHGDLEQVLKATDRAAGVTRQLLTFARQQIFQPVIVDPNKIIANLEKMLRRLVREDIELVFRSSADVGLVRADPGQLDQVILNLVVNATDAMPDGGRLVIETGIAYLSRNDIQSPFEATSGKFVMLSVADTGIGMSEENQARLFEPFFTTKPVGKGTGLGLATVYGIVTQAGGHMRVSSRLGDGTTFRIYLPAVEETVSTLGSPATHYGFQQGSETILLVEDQDDVRKLVCQILKTAGYSVLEAENGERALEMMEGRADLKIDLLASDVIMPRLGGKALAEQMRRERPRLKVLYISGYADPNFGEEGVLDANSSFLHKPFVPAALLAKVREVLDTPEVF